MTHELCSIVDRYLREHDRQQLCFCPLCVDARAALTKAGFRGAPQSLQNLGSYGSNQPISGVCSQFAGQSTPCEPRPSDTCDPADDDELRTPREIQEERCPPRE